MKTAIQRGFNMLITVSNSSTIAEAPDQLASQVKDQLSFQNPQWQENARMGRWNGNTPREIKSYKEGFDGDLILPRGFTRQLLAMCKKAGIDFLIGDQTRVLPSVMFNFQGQLRPFQKRAVTDIMRRRYGTLEAPTGSGKTVMALAIIALRQQPALVLVHTKELLHQWIDCAERFLGIPRKEIGIIGGGKKQIGDRLTIATVQTLVKCVDEVAPHIGFLICDECHRCPSRTFTEAVTAFDCRYLLGLSATPWRRDKLSKLIFWHLGDVHHQVDKAELEDAGHILRFDVITRETSFRSTVDPSTEYSRMLRELTEDHDRNRMIAADVADQVGAGVALVLTDRKRHCHELKALLHEAHGIEARVLTGDTPARQREELVEEINAGKVPVLIATGQLIGEGFDCRHLSTLFLATPIKFDGRLLQCIGRVLRPGPGKPVPKVFDYVDVHVGPLIAAARARQRVYKNAA
jgi:superfamily II DNA or RNA helicase